ncbi:hypothetical protein BTA51_13230 [Hahella sp. CCB-MM4]|uniref:PilZ domain-containing protein n=1 Tax=Hahella sp. (strain CCB-MM4) TaxID=1926491 RepID=UPI000B9C64BA|nr:PilZ domain-containing protein [Hahella sp. CCB-MM4]OZG72917.1 hypothetical protein BTA51_13230 [Hahella sp. CCB-MM4]
MEHRLDIRNRVNFTVRLRDASQSLGDFKVLNISEGGIGLEDSEGRLPEGDFVKVIFPHSVYSYQKDADGKTLMPEDCIMYGLVVHTTDGRAGLMWDSSEDDCIKLLPDDLIAA